ncbi:MAG TPA: hypothetical protein VEY51_21130 [Chondromyces sp.]|nr:hypothetical protein [Chondromyces sp.]
MDKWVLYEKPGNPVSDMTKEWFKNNGIPIESNSIFQLTWVEIEKLADLLPGGAKDLVYQDIFSFYLINPERQTEKEYIQKIHSGDLDEKEIRDLLSNFQSLIISPIVTNYKKILIGSDLDTMASASHL